jgi:SnoaL-like protein
MKKIWGLVGWGVGVVAVLALGAQTLHAQQESAGAAVTIATLQARLAALAPQVAYLKDRRDIFDTLKRYTRGVDRHDKELVRSAFWPDATISFDHPQKLDEYVDQEEALLATFAAHQHHITGQTIDIQGDTAHVESYVIYFVVPRDGRKDVAGPATPGRALTSAKSTIGSGRYIERWEKRNGEWRILVRNYVEDLQLQGDTVDYCGTRPCIGTWDRNDLSYMRPLQPITPEQRRERAEANKQTRSPVAKAGATK